jgi:hypothetical protein
MKSFLVLVAVLVGVIGCGDTTKIVERVIVEEGVQGIAGQTGPVGPQGPAGQDGTDGQDAAACSSKRLHGLYQNVSFHNDGTGWVLGDNSLIRISGKRFKHEVCGQGELEYIPGSDGCSGVVRATYTSIPDLCLDGKSAVSSYTVVGGPDNLTLITYLVGVQ